MSNLIELPNDMKTIKERLEEWINTLAEENGILCTRKESESNDCGACKEAYAKFDSIIAELDKAEPYGWLIDYADGSIHFLTDKKLVSGFAGTNSDKVIPLYTAPQPDNKELSLRVGMAIEMALAHHSKLSLQEVIEAKEKIMSDLEVKPDNKELLIDLSSAFDDLFDTLRKDSSKSLLTKDIFIEICKRHTKPDNIEVIGNVHETETVEEK